MAQFILMLTQADETVADPLAVYAGIRTTAVRFVGFKDRGVSPDTLRQLTDRVHADGRTAVMEIVSETADDELRSVDLGLELGVELLMGGRRPDLVLPRIAGAGIRYLPFCGTTTGHPSVLLGTPDEIGDHARSLTETPGVFGLDLLAYRYAGNVAAVMASVLRQSHGPVVAAGSIDRDSRIAAAVAAGCWGFTVGSAIFESAFVPGGDHLAQVEHVLRVAAAVMTDSGR